MKISTTLKTLIRVVLTVGFIYLVARIIEWNDRYEVQTKTEKILTSVEPTSTGDGYNVDGKFIPEKDVLSVKKKYGFLSLLKRLDLAIYIPAAIAILIPIFLLSFRWHIILKSQGFEIPFFKAFSINYAGIFFNNFLPGAVGGDIAKAILVSKDETRKAACVATVFLDRLLGLVAIFLIALVACLFNLSETNLKDPILFVLITVLFFYVAYRLYFSKTIRNWGFFLRLKERLPFKDTLKELDDVFKGVRRKKAMLIFTLCFSILTQACMIVIIYAHAVGLGIKEAQLVHFFMFMPIAFLITSIPITVGGWGLQEYTYVTLFSTIGVGSNEIIALSVLYKLSMIMISVPGAILFAAGFAKK